MSSASCDADAGASGFTCQKHHVALHFDHLYPWSVIMALTTLFTSCDAVASTNGIV